MSDSWITGMTQIPTNPKAFRPLEISVNLDRLYRCHPYGVENKGGTFLYTDAAPTGLKTVNRDNS